eukprot:758480-Hanusia_phi.AAC.9
MQARLSSDGHATQKATMMGRSWISRMGTARKGNHGSITRIKYSGRTEQTKQGREEEERKKRSIDDERGRGMRVQGAGNLPAHVYITIA